MYILINLRTNNSNQPPAVYPEHASASGTRRSGKGTAALAGRALYRATSWSARSLSGTLRRQKEVAASTTGAREGRSDRGGRAVSSSTSMSEGEDSDTATDTSRDSRYGKDRLFDVK
jgi:hypothetical protein